MRRSHPLLTTARGTCLALTLVAGGAAMSASALPEAGPGAVTGQEGRGSAVLPIPVDAGNGVTATITPSSGNVQVRSSVGLSWDSSIPGIDRNGLGAA